MSAANIGATLRLPGIRASVSSLTVEINQAEGGASALDRTKAVDTDPAGDFTSSGVVDPGAALPTPVEMALSFTSEYLRVSGSLTDLNLFSVISGSANFAIVKKVVDLDLDGNAGTTADQYNDAVMLTLALEALALKVGASGFGIDITSGQLGIASIQSGAWSWTAVRAANIGAKRSACLGSVRVFVPHGGDHYCVRDNGIGFDMKYADKLTQVFQKLHPNTKGAGLALPS